ncbi:MAG TPA: 5-(carboxyamino)imidazole ribonucleotide synthase [Phaeodactylibacter sp.]|nr:5-(carboxyamino)imidazole ribonucleotide synthase [Phaeodactylibacter sp.]
MQRKEKGFPTVGILGGGQLGRMLALAFAKWDGDLLVLDRRGCPAEGVACELVEGDFSCEEDVLRIGRRVDVLTIEIEQVHIGALRQLVAEGVQVHPRPELLEVIADKGLQKQFFRSAGFPTASFELYESAEAIREAVRAGRLSLPFVQKARKGGYDGRGVLVVREEADLKRLLPLPSVVEDEVEIALELAVIAARNPSGELRTYEPVEMYFHEGVNLLDYLIAPAGVSDLHLAEAEELAADLISAMDLCGLLAVEMFLTPGGDLLINEVAPRPHNSGHHTIEAAPCSQFEQHLRAILDLPLGDTRLHSPALMMNLLGPQGFRGPLPRQYYELLFSLPDVHVHLYGKKESRPFRKMGHLCLLAPSREELMRKMGEVVGMGNGE